MFRTCVTLFALGLLSTQVVACDADSLLCVTFSPTKQLHWVKVDTPHSSYVDCFGGADDWLELTSDDIDYGLKNGFCALGRNTISFTPCDTEQCSQPTGPAQRLNYDIAQDAKGGYQVSPSSFYVQLPDRGEGCNLVDALKSSRSIRHGQMMRYFA